MAGTVIFSMVHYKQISTWFETIFPFVTYRLAAVSGSNARVRGAGLGVSAILVGSILLGEDNGGVGVVLGLNGSRGGSSVVVLQLNGCVPQSHLSGLLLVGRQKLAGDGVSHGLLPEVGRLVDQGVVEDNAVLVVGVGGSVVSDKLDSRSGAVEAVDLRGDAPGGVGRRAGALAHASGV